MKRNDERWRRSSFGPFWSSRGVTWRILWACAVSDHNWRIARRRHYCTMTCRQLVHARPRAPAKCPDDWHIVRHRRNNFFFSARVLWSATKCNLFYFVGRSSDRRTVSHSVGLVHSLMLSVYFFEGFSLSAVNWFRYTFFTRLSSVGRI